MALALGFAALGELSGEVVVLHTLGEDGRKHATRLWIVEEGDSLWLRAGARAVSSPESWYARLLREPEVELERSGGSSRFEAVPAPEARAQVNRRMRAAYGLPDRIIGALRDPASSVPVRLERAETRDDFTPRPTP